MRMWLEFVVLVSSLCLGQLRCAAPSSWEPAEKEERLMGELRLVNEGLAHDSTHWYLSNKHFLYKATKSPVRVTIANHNAIPPELTEQGFDHIGDIDVFSGLLYGGMETSSPRRGAIGVWNCSDLSLVGYSVIDQAGVPWLAIDHTSRLLWSAIWSEPSTLTGREIESLSFSTVSNVTAPGGLPSEIQGAAFWEGDKGTIYLGQNGMHVFRMDLSTGALTPVLTAGSNPVEEMEGMTFWDLRDEGRGLLQLFGNFMFPFKAIRGFNPA